MSQSKHKKLEKRIQTGAIRLGRGLSAMSAMQRVKNSGGEPVYDRKTQTVYIYR